MNKIAMYDALLESHPLWEKTANPMALAAGLGGLAGGAAGGLSGGQGFDAKKALIGAGIGAAGGAGIRHGMNVSAAKNLAKSQAATKATADAAAKATAEAAKKSRNETGVKVLGGLGVLGAALAGGRAVRKGTETGAKIENALSRGAAIGREGLADINALTGAVNKAAPELRKGVESGRAAIDATRKTVADVKGLRDNVISFIQPAAKTAMYQVLLEDHHLWREED